MPALKAAVIGCGGRAKDHARSYAQLDQFKLVAVADIDRSRADAFSCEFKVKAYYDAEEMLQKEKPEVVSIVTQAKPRCQLTLLAANSGVKAIVAEKPIAISLHEADRMVATCEKNGVLLTVSHQMRFDPAFIHGKQAIDEGDIGEVYFIRNVGYGNLLEQGTHGVDMVLWFAGDSEVDWVMAQVDDVEGGRDLPHPAPNWTVGYLAFKNGIRAIIESGRLYTPVGGYPTPWLQKRVEALGTQGIVDSLIGARCVIISSKLGKTRTIETGIEGWNQATPEFMKEVAKVLSEGGTHRCDGKIALKGFEVIQAICQSALQGGIVNLPISRELNPLPTLMGL